MIRKLIAGAVGAGLMFAAAPALAGEWKFNPRACPDLVEDRYDRREDRRDARFNAGRRDRVEDRFDRRENRRDAAVTICPISAFYYVPDRWENRGWSRAGRYGRDRAYGRNARPPLQYDRRMRMHFRYADGRKIFVRA